MTVSELISYLNKFRPNTVVRAVDNNGNSSPFVMIRELADNSVEITGFPDYRHYYEKCQSDDYDDRDYLPGACNGDFLEGSIKMKCEHCGKRIERKTWYHWEDSGYVEDYCSVECALKENGLKRADETVCYECGKPITEMPYTDISGDLYCCIACALSANGIEERTK